MTPNGEGTDTFNYSTETDRAKAFENDMRRVKRIFRYINGTKDLGLTFKPGDGKITHYLCIPMILWNIQKVTLRNPIN